MSSGGGCTEEDGSAVLVYSGSNDMVSVKFPRAISISFRLRRGNCDSRSKIVDGAGQQK